MYREYWELFWTTGMPEAWLMSRDKEATSPTGAVQGGSQGGPGPLAGAPYPLSGDIPGNMGNLY